MQVNVAGTVSSAKRSMHLASNCFLVVIPSKFQDRQKMVDSIQSSAPQNPDFRVSWTLFKRRPSCREFRGRLASSAAKSRSQTTSTRMTTHSRKLHCAGNHCHQLSMLTNLRQLQLHGKTSCKTQVTVGSRPKSKEKKSSQSSRADVNDYLARNLNGITNSADLDFPGTAVMICRRTAELAPGRLRK